MALYTAIFEFKRGTYTSQLRAVSVTAAYRKWIHRVDRHGIDGVGETQRRRAVEELVTYEREGLFAPVALDGAQNVWYAPLPKALSSRWGILNIVKTVPIDSTPSNGRLQPTARRQRTFSPRPKRGR